MNDLAITKANVASGGPLAALVPQSLDEAFRLAKALSLSGDMVPKHFQGKPEMIMAAIARGMEIGLAPMQALSNIAVINGRASIWGDALPALLQRAGHHLDCDLRGEGDQMTAVATLTRGDTGIVITRSFSVADAKKAGLWGKAGPWQSYPARMLQMRARSYAARDGAADALMGLQVAEEVQDYAKDVTPPEPTRERVNLAQRLAPTPAVTPAVEGSFTEADQVDNATNNVSDTPAVEPHWTVGYEPSGGFPGSAAWDAGLAAAGDDRPLASVPYERGTEEADDWITAWHGVKGAQS